MNRTRIIYIVGGILLLAAAVIAYVLSTRNTETPPVSNTNQPAGPAVNISTNTNSQSNTNTVSEEQSQRTEVARIAVTFTEQFGTYRGSFDEDLLLNIKPLLTSSYYSQLERNLPTAAGEDTTTETQILSTNIATFSLSSSAVVGVSTLRREVDAEGTETLLSQELVVTEQYVDGEWLVSNAQWKTSETIEPI